VISPDLHRAVREIEGGCDGHGAVQPERLGPAIHAFEEPKQGVDARIKSAQDDLGLLP
jgi:hypothetical protein